MLVILIDRLNPEIRRMLTPELTRLAERPTDADRHEEIDILAGEMLASWHQAMQSDN